MGSILYTHLNDSLLLDKSLIADKFRSVSDSGLQIAMRQYREFCIAHLDDLIEEVAPEQGKLRLYVGDVADQRLLKQGAFYLDTVILSDPLFRLSEPEHESHGVWSQALDMPKPQRLDRSALVDAVELMRSCAWLVAQGYVRFFPTSLANEAPAQLPIYGSHDGFEEVLPPHLLALYKQAADVRSFVPTSRGLEIQPDLQRGRRIHIDFDRDGSAGGFIYNLMEQEVLSANRKTREVEIAMRMPDEPPSQEEFDAWVAQSVNRSARNHFDMVSRDVRWSTQFGSQYLTRSPFTASLLDSTEGVTSSSIPVATTTGWLQLDLPFFDRVSMEKLMAARSDEEAFRRFRLQLEKHFRELRLETDPEKRKLKTENAMHELLEIQRTEVDSAIRRLRRKGVLTGIGALVSLAAATATSGTSLIATMVAAYTGLKTIEEYRVSAKDSPAYFLWQTAGKKRL